jgi:hypothetical protein
MVDDTLLRRKWCSVDEEFAPDSPLEEGGFELMVPPRTERKWEGAGTQSSSRPRRGRRGSARNQRTKPI